MNHICKKCKSEISFANDIVSCPNCGRTYHKWCWKSVQNCVGCGAFNEEYSKELADRIANANTKSTKSDASDEIIADMDSGMFSNIGEKMKTLATVITVIGIIVGIIVCLLSIAMDTDMFFTGLLSGAIIAFCSWIGSFALYGFGALISSSQNTERLLSEVLKEMKNKA